MNEDSDAHRDELRFCTAAARTGMEHEVIRPLRVSPDAGVGFNGVVSGFPKGQVFLSGGGDR
jgi:hypothetical protein